MTAPARPSRLRWLVVLGPALLVALLEELSDTYLDPSVPFPLDNLAVTTAVLVIGTVFAWIAFRRIDQLTGTLRARNAELEARSASAQALNRVSVAIAAETGIDHVLRAVVAYARQLLEVDVAVLLLEGPDGRMTLRASDGLAVEAGGTADPGVGGEWPTARRRPSASAGLRASDDINTPDADAMLAFVDRGRAVARVAAPLQRGGSTIGVLAVGSAEVRAFGVDEVETLASLANQAVIAIEHDRLEARLRELAVADERERIARELHDGIAQVLGYVNTKSQAIDGYLADGRIAEARTQVAE
ncbi:MAG TPA: GAF domain-containing protein, partial [Candidatus Limnocylindrales bacterium]